MDIDSRLYVEIVPLSGSHSPGPHPIDQGRFDMDRIYKVLGLYNPSETGEAYFILANPDRQIWFISNRHLRAAGLFDSDELSMPISCVNGHPQARVEGRPTRETPLIAEQ